LLVLVLIYLFICQSTSTTEWRSDLFHLWVKLSPLCPFPILLYSRSFPTMH